MRTALLAGCCLLSVSSVFAQDSARVAAPTSPATSSGAEVDPRHLLPVDYTVLGEVNVAKLIEMPLFSAIERSIGNLILSEFEGEFGFAFEELDLIRWGMVEDFPGPDEDSGPYGSPRRQSSATIFKGTEEVKAVMREGRGHEPLPEDLAKTGITGHSQYGDVWLQVAEGTLVSCDDEWALEVLSGKARGGVPSPQLAALIAGPAPIARMTGLLPPTHIMEKRGMAPIPVEWIDLDAPPVAVDLRLNAGEKGASQISMRMVFSRGAEAGRDAMLAKVREALAEAKQGPVPPPLVPVLDAVKIEADGSDVLATLEIPANGGPLMDALPLVFMGFASASDVPAEEVVIEIAEPDAIEEVEEEPEPEVEEKSGGKKKQDAHK